MFIADTKNKQRSGQSANNNWTYQNRTAAATQHTNAEVIAAQDVVQNNRRRPLRPPIGGGGAVWI